MTKLGNVGLSFCRIVFPAMFRAGLYFLFNNSGVPFCRWMYYFCNVNELENIMSVSGGEPFLLKAMGESVPAGFPSPAQDCDGDTIDLNKELIRHPAATFCARVSGNSMRDCGIGDGDLLIIDKSLLPRDGCVAVCFIDGEFTLKRIAIRRDGIWLVPANPDYPELHVTEGCNFQVWGIVSFVVKDMKNSR